MNLAQQQAYCSALGIDIWVARRPLAGAARGHYVLPLPAAQPLFLKSQPAAAATSAATPNARTAARTAARTNARPASPSAEQAAGAPAARAAGRQMLDDFVDANAHATAKAKAKPVGRHVSASQLGRKGSEPGSGLRFAVVCVVHEQMLLLDEITGLKFTPSAYNDWLKSIFYALGIPNADISVGQQDRLMWPPTTSPVNPVSAQAARSAAADMLHAWLQRKLVQKQGAGIPPNILLMGRAPRELLLAKGSPAAVGDMAELPLLGGKRALLLPGSNEIWAAPQLKREYWQQLQKSGIAGHAG